MLIEPLDIPMLHGRIAIAAAALSHSLFATFIVGASLIGAITATAAYATRRPWYDRLAHMIAFALVLSTATISFLGVSFVFLLNIYWPRFWHTIFRIMFWPFLLEACLFLGEAIFVYTWYYLWSWSRSARLRGLHLSFIWLAAGCALAAMFMIDITASYMLTPHPPASAWENIFNPTMIHLDLHRWFGNLTWAGFALAALCAIAFLRGKDQDKKIEYQRAGGFCFLIGFSSLLVMPVIGYQYLLNVRYGEPQAFQTLMLGERSWLFDVVALLYGLLVLLGSWYIDRMVRASGTGPASFQTFMPISLFVLSVAAIVFALPYHIQHIPLASSLTELEINPWGKMQPNKYFAIAVLIMFGLVNALYFVHSFRRAPLTLRPGDRTSPSLLIALALCAVVIMLAMGWTRETARAANGYLIYGHFSFSDEQRTYTAPP
ncbi:MAG: cytochrome ubiquinol oxidase subunit I [Nitrospiraceae bacterium]